MRALRRLRPSPALIVACLALILAAGGVTFAAIPGPDGTIKGCQLPANGGFRVIDHDQNCKANERTVTWNQAGEPGPPGVSGFEYVDAFSELDSTDFKEAIAHCPTGKKAIGSGAFIIGAEGVRASFTGIYPRADFFDPGKGEVIASAQEMVATPLAWQVHVRAVCAHVD
jgi:hypothetical protein